MCPVCMTTLAAITAVASSTSGITAVVVRRLRRRNGRDEEKEHGTVQRDSAGGHASDNRGDEQMGSTWNYLDITALGRQEEWEDSPPGYPQTSPYKWWNWHDEYDRTESAQWASVVDRGLALQNESDPKDGNGR